jgi:methionine-rich copper-binding protein CopC
MKRLLSGLVLALALLGLLPGLAAAHAKLVSSDPADGAQIALTEAPTMISLTFSEEVAKDVTTVRVTGPDGVEVTNGAATVDFDNPMLVTVPLKALTGGMYTVAWHAVTADDNGQTDGTFQFTVVVNTGGTMGGDTTTSGASGAGAPSGNTGATNTLPGSGEPLALMLVLGLAGLATLLLGTGLALRRHIARRTT